MWKWKMTAIRPDSTVQLPVVPETADAALLERALKSVADIEAIERTPLDERLRISNFSRRIDLALAARGADDTAIFYVPDGDVTRTAARVSFRDLRRNIDRTACLLRAHGIGRNDVVAIVLPNVPQIYWSILGAMAAGIVFPINWMMEPHSLHRLLMESAAKAVISLGPTPGFKIWESIMSIAGDLPAGTRIWSVAGPEGNVLGETDLDIDLSKPMDRPVPGDDIHGATIGAYVHSGGTTGLPKIVKLSHRNMSYRHWTLQLATRLFLGEVILHDTPMFHVGGLIGRCLPPLASGASILIPSTMGARDKRYISNYWKFVEKYRVTRLSGVPTTLAVLAKSSPQQSDLSSLEPYFITGSTALPTSVRQAFEHVSGVRVLNSYGMTENTASVAIDPRDGVSREGSSRIRLPYTEIRVVLINAQSQHVRLCGPEEIGMLQVRGPGIASGYLNPAHQVGALTEDGWLITGDLGRIDSDGYVFVTGRAKDIIIRGGHNIDPALIEEPLLRFPEVLHAAAVGKPDSYAGEIPIAYVQLVSGAQTTEADLMRFLTGCIAERAAIPKEIIIVEKLPLTDVGKPIKAALRKDIAERTFRSVLSETTALSCKNGQLEIAVNPHPTWGLVVSIVATGVPAAEQAKHTARISEIMNSYYFAYTVEWT
jgi:fatty-acyl-CoA synthase